MPKYDSNYRPDYIGAHIDDGFPGKYSLGIIRTEEELRKVLLDYRDSKRRIFSFDFETSSLDMVNKGVVVGVSFCFDGRKAWYIPMAHKVGVNAEPGLDKYLIACIKSAEAALVFNAEFEYRCLRKLGWDIDNLYLTDVMNVVWNVDTNVTKLNLKGLEKDILGWERTDFEDTFGKGNTVDLVTPEETYEYACFDSISPLLFYVYFHDFVDKNKGVIKVDQELVKPVMCMEDYPFQFDVDALKAMAVSIYNRMKKTESDIYKVVGYEFNINSSTQIAEALDRAGVDTGERTAKGQMKTGEDMLIKIADEYPIVRKIIDYRHDQKKLGTYVNSMIKEVERTGNKLHFKYFMSRVPSARLAAGGDKKNPYYAPINIQNIIKPGKQMFKAVMDDGPKSVLGWSFTPTDEKKGDNLIEGMDPNENLRACFTLPEDHYWVSCDFCLSEDTKIKTPDGDMTALQVFQTFKKRIVQVETPLGPRQVLKAEKTRPMYQYDIILENGVNIRCSYNHVWMVKEPSGALLWKETHAVNLSDCFIAAGDGDFIRELLQETIVKGTRDAQIVTGDIQGTVKIYDIKKVDPDEQDTVMYDFEIEEAHCFFAGGVVSHNSGQELRLPAIFSGEPLMVNTFKNNGDLHGEVAVRMGIDRPQAKTLNFGVLYGGSEYTMYKALGIPLDKAKIYIDGWWKSMPKLDRWAKSVKRESQKTGYSTNYFGRRRPLRFWYKSGNRKLIGFANRSALNHKIQSTGGDIMRICLIKMYKELVLQKEPGFMMLSSIHDEINMAMHKDVIRELLPRVVNLMEIQMPSWPIKLTVGIEIGWTWGSLFSFKLTDGELLPAF